MTEFENSRAKRVCDKCFGGDAVAMLRYAEAYLAGGHTAVRPLGSAFRNLLPGRARREFWQKAIRQLSAHLDAVPVVSPDILPAWTKVAGGERKWREWAKRQAARCHRRAKTWVAKRGGSGTVSTRVKWREAIMDAIRNSDGRGHFSRLPLSLEGAKPTDPQWPSIEHLVDPADLDVALEQRLFNDMKSILSIEEFRSAIGHLVSVLAVQPKKLPDQWRPARSFGTAEKSEEPPLPGK